MAVLKIFINSSTMKYYILIQLNFYQCLFIIEGALEKQSSVEYLENIKFSQGVYQCTF